MNECSTVVNLEKYKIKFQCFVCGNIFHFLLDSRFFFVVEQQQSNKLHLQNIYFISMCLVDIRK